MVFQPASSQKPVSFSRTVPFDEPNAAGPCRNAPHPGAVAQAPALLDSTAGNTV